MDKIKDIMDKYCEAQTSDSEETEIRKMIIGLIKFVKNKIRSDE